MVDGSLCRARHGRASETVHFPALRFVHAPLSPRSRCGCVALRCGLLGAIAARLVLRLYAAGARLPASLFLAGWPVFRCGVLLISPAARAWRGSFFKLPSCWLPLLLAGVRVSASFLRWLGRFLGLCLGLARLCRSAALRLKIVGLLVLHGPSPLAGFRAGIWVPPNYGLAGVCCGAGTTLAFLARCALVGSRLVLLPPLLRVWARLVALRLRGALFGSPPVFAVVDHFGVPACRLASAGPFLTHARPACCRVRACLAHVHAAMPAHSGLGWQHVARA